MSNTPKHYEAPNFITFLKTIMKKGSCDIIDITYLFNLKASQQSILKYIVRAGKKDGEGTLKDLAKAIDYIVRDTYFITATQQEKEDFLKKLHSITEDAKMVLSLNDSQV